jgi:hypothetical protein
MKSAADSVVSNNIFSDFSFTTNSVAVLMNGDDDNYVSTGITIQNNLAYRIRDQAFIIEPRSRWSNIKVLNNTIQDPDLGAAMVAQHGSFASVGYSGNTYGASNASKFALVGSAVDGSNAAPVTASQWVAQSGETGAKMQSITYPDPGRNLDSYVKTLTPSMTLSAFYTAVRTQSKASWNPAYTAAAVNDYIRAGFGMAAFKP